MSLLIYPGSKRKHIADLMEYMPSSKELIVSPFFGGGSFEFHLAELGYPVIACDAFESLVNFWTHIRLHPGKVADVVLTCVPMTKQRFREIRRKLVQLKAHKTVQHAAMFFILNRCSYSGKHDSFSQSKIDAFNTSYKSLTLKVRNFKWPENLLLFHTDYRNILNQHPKAFVYADPPYFLRVNRMYGFNGEHHKDFDHYEFAEEMKQRRSKWIITYNPHETILNLYKGFRIHDLQESTGFKQIHKEFQGHIVITNF